MRAEFRLLTGRLAGKIILTPETPEEEASLNAFRQEVGIPQRGRKLDVVYKRRIVGPEAINKILREGRADAEGVSGAGAVESQDGGREVGVGGGPPARP